jgi:hypothetical protein
VPLLLLEAHLDSGACKRAPAAAPAAGAAAAAATRADAPPTQAEADAPPAEARSGADAAADVLSAAADDALLAPLGAASAASAAAAPAPPSSSALAAAAPAPRLRAPPPPPPPALRRVGQHTGRAAGTSAPAPLPPPSAVAAFASFHTPQISASAASAAGASAPPDPRMYGLPGQLTFPDFLSAAEEAALLAALEAPTEPAWQADNFAGRGRCKWYGPQLDLRLGEVSPPLVPFPPWLVPIVARLRTLHPLLARFDPTHANAIEYVRARGDALRPHVDERRLCGDVIVNISLAGGCVMTYAHAGGGRLAQGEVGRVRVALPVRCAQVQSGAARFRYTHSIANEDLPEGEGARRVSITMRETAVTQARAPGAPRAAPAAAAADGGAGAHAWDGIRAPLDSGKGINHEQHDERTTNEQ